MSRVGDWHPPDMGSVDRQVFVTQEGLQRQSGLEARVELMQSASGPGDSGFCLAQLLLHCLLSALLVVGNSQQSICSPATCASNPAGW
jgi:hypothetical protein